jgi:hypothetical protein
MKCTKLAGDFSVIHNGCWYFLAVQLLFGFLGLHVIFVVLPNMLTGLIYLFYSTRFEIPQISITAIIFNGILFL